MAEKILFVSGKGGVGISTLCTALGKALAHSGSRVLIEEADSGFGCIDMMLGLQDEVIYNLEDALSDAENYEKSVIKDESLENLFYMPCAYGEDFVPDEEAVIELHKIMDSRFDFILIDGGCGCSEKIKPFIQCADKFLMVVTPDEICLRSSEKLAENIRNISNNDIRLIINKVNLYGKNPLNNFDEIIDKTSAQLIGIVPYTKVFNKGTFSKSRLLWQKSINNLSLRLKNFDIYLAII